MSEPSKPQWSFRSSGIKEPGKSTSGLRQTVCDIIQNDPLVPEHWKAALISEINSLPNDIQAVKLDAYPSDTGNLRNYHFTISKLF